LNTKITFVKDAFLCGHDHSMQHLSYNRTEYYLSGRGGNIYPGAMPPGEFPKTSFLGRDFCIKYLKVWHTWYAIQKTRMQKSYVCLLGL